MLLDILRCLPLEKDIAIVEDLCALAVDATTMTSNMGLFSNVMSLLQDALHTNDRSANLKTIHGQPGSAAFGRRLAEGILSTGIAEGC